MEGTYNPLPSFIRPIANFSVALAKQNNKLTQSTKKLRTQRKKQAMKLNKNNYSVLLKATNDFNKHSKNIIKLHKHAKLHNLTLPPLKLPNGDIIPLIL